MRIVLRASSIVVSLLASGCCTVCCTEGKASSSMSGCGAPSPNMTAAFEQLKTLEGEWTNPDENGQTRVGSVFKVSSAGSAVREVMFPGSNHEMTNMIHLDGDAIVATHYCAIGNQPRMRCTNPANGVFAFRFEDITNLTDPASEHMAELTLTIKDKDHIRQEWWSQKGGDRTGPVVFDLTRK